MDRLKPMKAILTQGQYLYAGSNPSWEFELTYKLIKTAQ